MTTTIATKRIDVDTHFYPRVDYKSLKEHLPRHLVDEAKELRAIVMGPGRVLTTVARRQ